MKNYIQSCQTEFWQKVFEAESKYLVHELRGARKVLSIGCGPAIIEKKLAEYGFPITGLDVSKKLLDFLPDSVRPVVGSAERMPFAKSSFDAVIYVVSLQFIENYKKAIKETENVLRHNGRLVIMLLNPESIFFKEKHLDSNSYISQIKHTNLRQIEAVIAERFKIKTEYFLGIKNKTLFETQNHKEASLYIIKGIKRRHHETYDPL